MACHPGEREREFIGNAGSRSAAHAGAGTAPPKGLRLHRWAVGDAQAPKILMQSIAEWKLANLFRFQKCGYVMSS